MWSACTAFTFHLLCCHGSLIQSGVSQNTPFLFSLFFCNIWKHPFKCVFDYISKVVSSSPSSSFSHWENVALSIYMPVYEVSELWKHSLDININTFGLIFRVKRKKQLKTVEDNKASFQRGVIMWLLVATWSVCITLTLFCSKILLIKRVYFNKTLLESCFFY